MFISGQSSSDVSESIIPTDTVTSSSFDPGGIEFSKTYYWRVDEFDGVSTYTGDIWQFTTGSAFSVPAFPGAEGAGKWSAWRAGAGRFMK